MIHKQTQTLNLQINFIKYLKYQLYSIIMNPDLHKALEPKTTKKNIVIIKDSKEIADFGAQIPQITPDKNKFTFKQKFIQNTQSTKKQGCQTVKQASDVNNVKNQPWQPIYQTAHKNEPVRQVNQQEFMLHTLIQVNQQVTILKNRVEQLEQKLYTMQSSLTEDKKKKIRRRAQEIQKNYICPYQNCQKSYGSDVSMNLHIKLKHNGGTKTQRQQYIKSIKAGEEVVSQYSFPPDLLKKIQEESSQMKTKK